MRVELSVVKNVYHKYRLAAAETDVQMRSRAGAARRLHIAAETLRDYETDVSRVPADVVMRMADVYNVPELRNYYCHHSCPIGSRIVPAIDDKHLVLDRLTVRLLGSFRKIAEIRDKLIDIAEDGVISEKEKPDFHEILDTLDAISVHTQELKVWAEKEFKKSLVPYKEA